MREWRTYVLFHIMALAGKRSHVSMWNLCLDALEHTYVFYGTLFAVLLIERMFEVMSDFRHENP